MTNAVKTGAVQRKAISRILGLLCTFSSFAVNDVKLAMSFYGETLGLNVDPVNGGFELTTAANRPRIFVYQKEGHRASGHSVLTLYVDDIAASVNELRSLGVVFERYPKLLKTDREGIWWGKGKHSGPNIAWFKDPSGNIVSLLEPTQGRRKQDQRGKYDRA